MTIELHALQRIALTKEANSAFAVDVTASATYLDLPFQEGTAQITLTTPQLEPNTVQQKIDAYEKPILGPRSASLAFSIRLAATGVAAGDGADSPAEDDSALLQLLAIVFGGIEDSNTGTDVASATDANTFVVTSATDLVAGGALGWPDSAGTIHAREMGAVAGTSITTKIDLTATPSSSDVIYAATTIYPTANPDTSIQMIVEGSEQDNRWLLMGGQLTSAPTLSWSVGEIPTLSFTVEFADFALEPSAAISTATYAAYSPIYSTGFVRGKLSNSTSTLTVLDAAKVEITLNGPAYGAVKSPSGTNTISRWRRMRTPPLAEISFVVPYEDQTWFTHRNNRATYHFEVQDGTTAGGIVLLTFPACHVVDVQLVDEGNLSYQRVTLKTTTDGQISGSTDLPDAAMRIHFL